MKFDMCFMNMYFNGYIFKIFNHVNLFSISYSLILQLSLKPNFGPLNNILGFYKKKRLKKNFIELKF